MSHISIATIDLSLSSFYLCTLLLLELEREVSRTAGGPLEGIQTDDDHAKVITTLRT